MPPAQLGDFTRNRHRQGMDEGQVATYPARVDEGRILLDAAFLRERAVA